MTRQAPSGSAIDVEDHPLYQADVAQASQCDLPWEKLHDATVLVTGSTGLIGSHLIDVLMHHNVNDELQCTVVAIGRNETKARKRFAHYWWSPWFRFAKHDIVVPLCDDEIPLADYVIHLASNTHPRAYATDPIGTITANINGTQNMLDYAVSCKSRRALFASSCEIYGENRGDTTYFAEDYCGYIDSNTLRAGYPESKRCGEALCQAYIRQHNLEVVIPRLARCYGPTMLPTDSKASSQFIHNGLRGEDIVLKSKGDQHYSYIYASDAVTALLTVLLQGKNGLAYNVADCRSDIYLRDLAQLIASYSDVRVTFDIPDAIEQAGFSTATTALLDSGRLQALGWRAQYDIQTGVKHTLDILSSCHSC
ncbi:dTDP-glucose 4,6-dehydratase [Bifidobacterium lemurum]|uniref:dTDP-glucose 4,6-dehydratase n=1 Tax=Bifidobacterium lemurum TaxID=1603886 RepID=A0A261FRG6_9BIFI|nr:NAD-dependent epimerase/dehydratase family protein [Bifidobacterium lemurum]OZG61780.1 dTDP-glucose 4,6-dehydratase [Bifidobacterium lemurum]QOL34933.1 NAD-dependent epimerase/dehydratase family protein [Bifidobacterium lemurum]